MFKAPPLISRFGVGVLVALWIACTANATDCAQHYVQGQAPVFINEKVAVSTTELCYEAFGVESGRGAYCDGLLNCLLISEGNSGSSV